MGYNTIPGVYIPKFPASHVNNDLVPMKFLQTENQSGVFVKAEHRKTLLAVSTTGSECIVARGNNGARRKAQG